MSRKFLQIFYFIHFRISRSVLGLVSLITEDIRHVQESGYRYRRIAKQSARPFYHGGNSIPRSPWNRLQRTFRLNPDGLAMPEWDFSLERDFTVEYPSNVDILKAILDISPFNRPEMFETVVPEAVLGLERQVSGKSNG